MGKIIFLAIIGVIGWVLFKGLGKGRSKSVSKPARDDDKQPPNGKAVTEAMVKCHRCSVMMPESESMILDGHVSCRDPAHCLHRA